ncbi:PREDICTED: cytochrome P450 3A1-like [Gavialis gangeticus]|uniref:cytochrome P450 3A1-like n=1 Tax=Gavialis gangeticus TaxID=94835 RepID=UPI00092F0506|nr:PREDICTED: cytochrome P450 3A1-like [Gavialis gangeticus]
MPALCWTYDGRQPMTAIVDTAIIKAILVKDSRGLFTNRRDFGLNGVLGCAITRARDEQGKRICTAVFLTFTSRRRKWILPIINCYAETLMKMVQKKVANEESMDMKNIFGAYIGAFIFAFAGYETTLKFLSSNLATHPAVQQQLQEEIDAALPNKAISTYKAVVQMEYLDMVVNESIKLFPPSGWLETACKKTIVTNGATLPKGTVTMIQAYMLHHDPSSGQSPRSSGLRVDSMNNPKDPFVAYIKKYLEFKFLNPVLMLVVVFPFLTPVLKKMNVTVMPTGFMDFFFNVLRNIKEERQKNRNTERVDFLQLMLDAQNPDDRSRPKEEKHAYKTLTDTEILAQALVFILAGYETTSSTLSFISYNLATHPDVQQRLHEEIDAALPNRASPAYEAVMQMEYLDMVVNETLRLFPPGGRIERVCKETTEINGVTIPKGTLTVIPSYVLHRDPEHWPEPEEFRPERFSKENRDSMDPYIFLPFGAGPRNCIGMRFALLSLKMALVVLLQRFSFRTCKDTPVPLVLDSKGFMQPKKPIILKMVPRTHMQPEE